MRPRATVACTAVLFAAVALAGCSTGGDAPMVVHSSDAPPAPEDIPAPPEAPAGKGVGHIAGVVVDDAYHPLAKVRVRLPAMDLRDETDRDGVFEFVDLAPGSYLLGINVTGHRPLETVVEVKADAFKRLVAVVERIPPPDPFHVTMEWQGHAYASGPYGWLTSCDCSWPMDLAGAGLEAVVFEATMDGYAGLDGAGSSGFLLDVDPQGGCCGSYVSEELPNPMHYVAAAEQLGGEDLDVSVRPTSFPLVEMDKPFEVHATAFYHAPPPEGWSSFVDT